MVRREADRARVVAEVVQAQRVRVADQHAEDAAAAGQVADRRVRLVVDAVVTKRSSSRPLGRSRRAPRSARRSARRPARPGAAAAPSSESSEASAMPASSEGAQPVLARRRCLHAASVLRTRASSGARRRRARAAAATTSTGAVSMVHDILWATDGCRAAAPRHTCPSPREPTTIRSSSRMLREIFDGARRRDTPSTHIDLRHPRRPSLTLGERAARPAHRRCRDSTVTERW